MKAAAALEAASASDVTNAAVGGSQPGIVSSPQLYDASDDRECSVAALSRLSSTISVEVGDLVREKLPEQAKSKGKKKSKAKTTDGAPQPKQPVLVKILESFDADQELRQSSWFKRDVKFAGKVLKVTRVEHTLRMLRSSKYPKGVSIICDYDREELVLYDPAHFEFWGDWA